MLRVHLPLRVFLAASLAVGVGAATLVSVRAATAAELREAPAPDITAQDAIKLLVDAYRRGPVADRVQVRVVSFAPADPAKPAEKTTDKPGTERRATVVLRVDRGDAAGFRPRQLRLELGSLLLHADHSMLLAISRLEPRSCFETELARGLRPQELAAVIPPLPLPQIALALGDDSALADPLPYVRNVTWSGVESKQLAGKPVYVVKGTSRSGEVSITLDQVSGRLRQMSADVLAAGSEGRIRVELVVNQIDPGDPNGWTLSSADRERVAALDLLGPRAGDLTVGQKFPSLPILDAALAPFTPADVLGTANPPGALVLVAFRPSADTDEARLILADAKAGIGALQGLAIKSAKGIAPLAVRPLAVLEGEEIAVDRLAAWHARWDAVDQKTLGQRFGSMLSTSSSGIALDRFGPGLAAALIIIGGDQRVLGVVPLDGRADDERTIRREFIAASGAIVDETAHTPERDRPIGPPVPMP
ncbi:MAG: hypothetical protein SFY96_04690 [Planctomycetota bacterium]|nr:hypothetical protein [Planctomycetota bacterium]